MQVRVIKADGSKESYLHTKIIRTLSRVIDIDFEGSICLAEELAEALTYYIYSYTKTDLIYSYNIHSMLLAMITDTGYENYGSALQEHHINRVALRKRIEVVTIDDPFEAGIGFCDPNERSSRWNKSIIVNCLESIYGLEHYIARTIAGEVEGKVLHLGTYKISRSLIKQLVISEASAMLNAQAQLNGNESFKKYATCDIHTDTEVCPGKFNNGLCNVGA